MFDEQFSVVSIESILFYIVAFCVWTLETLFDTHRTELESLYSEHHAHTFEWYNNKAKAFLYGHSLIPFTSNYDTTSISDEQISAARIVSHASCVKGFNANNISFLRLKVAKLVNDELDKLTDVELAAFADYMAEIQDAGVDLICSSGAADNIRMEWIVYYDAQALDGDGNRLDGSASDVVRKAIRDYVQALPFNGLYKLTFHVDAVQGVRGVMDAYVTGCWVKPNLSGQYLALTDEGTVADSGYFKFYENSDLIVTMKAFDN
jgi:hypothetical protein